jgi:transglutaminase-like putative cysteine protease
MQAVHREFVYQPGVTTSATSPEEAFASRRGVCQDFAHVMIVALRSQGVPAAYASGYLRTVPPPGKPRLVGADAMHAWVMVWCGRELGWVGFDPTNDCLARGDHILIAMGRDYADVAPIDGTFVGSPVQSLTSSVDVEWFD